MCIFIVTGEKYDNVVVRRVAKRSERQYQSYQIYRNGSKAVATASITWTIENNSTVLTIKECPTETPDMIIIPEEFESKYVTAINPDAFKETRTNKVKLVASKQFLVRRGTNDELAATKEIDVTGNDKITLER